jgi:SNF2 family DNA or RNA helicase
VLRPKVDTLACDESSNVKHTNTQRFKRLRPLLPRFRRRWILTGSIAPNGLLDVFGQVYVADMGVLFGPYITGYRRQYFTPGGYGGYEWKITPKGEETITAKLKGGFLRLDAEDYLSLPPLSIVKLEIDLPPAARKTYNNLEAAYFDIVDKDSITAVNAGAALMKCRQVASGGVYNDADTSHKRAVTHMHSEKTLALFNLVEELNGQPLLVFYSFEHDVTRILDVLGEDTPVLGGGTSDKRTAEIIADWNAGKIQVLLAHPKSASHGLNLQEGNCGHVAWYSIDYDWDQHDQGTRRIRRQGNEAERIMSYYIMARDTIDEVIFEALQYKQKRQTALLDSLKTYRLRKQRK